MGASVSSETVVRDLAPKGTEFCGRGAAVVTGSTSGLGVPTTEAMLAAGFDRVFATARSEALGAALVAQLKDKLGDAVVARLTVVPLDLANLSSVVAAAARIDAESGADGVSVLVNNAGINTGNTAPTADGFELQIGTNHIGPLCFTDALLPALARSGAKTHGSTPGDFARVVFVSSGAHKWAIAGDGFDAALWKHDPASTMGMWTRYANSKLANVLTAVHLDETCQTNGVPVAFFSCHPGVVSTGIVRDYPAAKIIKAAADVFVKTPAQGAATQVFCALSSKALESHGQYFENCHATPASAQGQDKVAAAKLVLETRRAIDQVRARAMADARE